MTRMSSELPLVEWTWSGGKATSSGRLSVMKRNSSAILAPGVSVPVCMQTFKSITKECNLSHLEITFGTVFTVECLAAAVFVSAWLGTTSTVMSGPLPSRPRVRTSPSRALSPWIYCTHVRLM
jgi:hypothetical protein